MLLFLFYLLRFPGTNRPYNHADQQKGACRQNEKAVGHIPASFGVHGNHRKTEQLARADQLADGADDQEDEGITQAVADAVDKAVNGWIFQSKGFGAAHENAVGDDQADVHGQLFADIKGVRFDDLIGNDDQRCYDGHFYQNANAAGNMIPDETDCEIGKSDHKNDCKRHDNRCFQFRGDGERGTYTEYLATDGIVVENRVNEECFVFLHLYPFRIYSAHETDKMNKKILKDSWFSC